MCECVWAIFAFKIIALFEWTLFRFQLLTLHPSLILHLSLASYFFYISLFFPFFSFVSFAIFLSKACSSPPSIHFYSLSTFLYSLSLSLYLSIYLSIYQSLFLSSFLSVINLISHWHFNNIVTTEIHCKLPNRFIYSVWFQVLKKDARTFTRQWPG